MRLKLKYSLEQLSQRYAGAGGPNVGPVVLKR